ncbi:hypothetical protein [Pseudaestuariivita atlantica]|uniref:Uncharacterized protein n=1 Tax=Pseudaestuariivita atlantica TaxID=1317121 RepID=A0A0L1JM81_9RHOB|nr:hypothetical protein [Pseudaestuariivita atlantica]KNG92865.1 hypothetical protein ATO11_15500 [Pseudaestuariivita atlantica]
MSLRKALLGLLLVWSTDAAALTCEPEIDAYLGAADSAKARASLDLMACLAQEHHYNTFGAYYRAPAGTKAIFQLALSNPPSLNATNTGVLAMARQVTPKKSCPSPTAILGAARAAQEDCICGTGKSTTGQPATAKMEPLKLFLTVPVDALGALPLADVGRMQNLIDTRLQDFREPYSTQRNLGVLLGQTEWIKIDQAAPAGSDVINDILDGGLATWPTDSVLGNWQNAVPDLAATTNLLSGVRASDGTCFCAIGRATTGPTDPLKDIANDIRHIFERNGMPATDIGVTLRLETLEAGQ